MACPSQRCTVHFVGRHPRSLPPRPACLVSATLREVFNAEHHAQARERLTHVLARLADARVFVATGGLRLDPDAQGEMGLSAAGHGRLRPSQSPALEWVLAKTNVY